MQEYTEFNKLVSLLSDAKEDKRDFKMVYTFGYLNTFVKELEEIKSIIEKKETNFERLLNHLWSFRVEHDSDSVSIFKLEFAMSEDFGEIPYHPMNDFILWLKRPYQKPKIKLTQFEYDSLSCCDENKRKKRFSYFTMCKQLKNKGYYKGVYDVRMTIEEILNNCEIVND